MNIILDLFSFTSIAILILSIFQTIVGVGVLVLGTPILLLLGFEMLEALRPGINYTWTIGYQKTVSKNLQITFQYLGRKSEDSRIIHTGGMEIRAFF